jgi:hypothetical protein
VGLGDGGGLHAGELQVLAADPLPPRPVVFIRIVGTHNSANEVFHCVHFECPSCETQGTSGGKPSNRSATPEKDINMVATEMATEAEEMPSDDD